MRKTLRHITLIFSALLTSLQFSIAQKTDIITSLNSDEAPMIKNLPDEAIVGLDVQFGGTDIPEGWQTNELGDSGHGWNLHDNMIWINSNFHPNNHVAGELISPVIDCSQMEVVLLGINLDYYFYPLPDGMTDAEIRYSTDGTNWHTYYTFTDDVGGLSGKYFEWDLTSIAAGEEEFYLKFWFDDQDVLRAYWQIYSVTVYAPTKPEFSVKPAVEALNFPITLIEESSEPQTVTITNTGIGNLVVQAPSVNDDTNFLVIYDNGSFPATLAFHESVNFNVVFHPITDGNKEAMLSINYTEDAPGQHNIELTGEAIDPLVDAFPWSEGFNKKDFPPLGWKAINGVEGAEWHSSTVKSYEGSRSARAYYGSRTGRKANEWLVSPPMDLSQPEAELLSFWVSSNNEADSITDKIQVWLLTDMYDNVEDLEINGQMIGEVYVNEDWERKSFDIREYTGIYYFAFRYHVNHTKSSRYVYLDFVQIEELETFTLNMLEPVGDEGRTKPETGEYTYYSMEEVTLIADIDYAWGWKFDKWEVDGTFYSDEPIVKLTMDTNKEAQAFFSPGSESLTIEMLPTEGHGTTLPTTGQHQYQQGIFLSIEALPAYGWEFTHWEKNGTNFSTENPKVITVEEAGNYKAIYTEAQPLSISFTVVNEEGEAINNAQIRLNEVNNPEGQYTFNNLYPGKHYYSITAPGHLPTGDELILTHEELNSEIILIANDEETLDFSITIVTNENLPIENATAILNGYANLQGNYQFTDFPAGEYTIKILSDDYGVFENVVTISEEELSTIIVLGRNSRLWYENFEQDILPGGWSIMVHGEPGYYWEFTDGTAVIDPAEEYYVSASLVSPAIPVSDAEAIGVKMNHFYNPYANTSGEIRISSDGLTWHTAAIFRNAKEGEFLSEEFLNYYLTEHFAFDEKVYISFYYSALNSLGSSFYNWTINSIEAYIPEPYALDAERMSNHLTLNEGKTENHRLRIKNFGGFDDTFSIEQLTGEWSYDFPESIDLVAGKQSFINIPFTVPANLEMGTRDSLTLRITSEGDPSITQDILFVCGAISTIKNYYEEDFDLAYVPNLPGGWSFIKNSSAANASVGTVSTASSSLSSPNALRLRNSYDINAELIAISPRIDDSKSMSDFRTRFWMKSSRSSIQVGTMDSPDGTFTPLDEFMSENHYTWEEFMFGFENYTGSDRYIAFRQKTSEESTQVLMDDVVIETIPSPIFNINLPSHDFGDGWLNYLNDSVELTITNRGHYDLIVNEIGLEQKEHFTIEHSVLPDSLKFNEPLIVRVFFNPQELGEVADKMIINFKEVEEGQFTFALSGNSIPRPQGSTCEDPIPVSLPLVDLKGTLEQYGNDYGVYDVTPANIFLRGNDKVMQFTLDEPSLISGDVSGSQAGFFILKTCPDSVNPAQVIAGAYNLPDYKEFNNIPIEAGTYFLLTSTMKLKPPYTTEYTINLSAIPLPNSYNVTFFVSEDSEEKAPLAKVDIQVEGELISKTLKTGSNGKASTNLWEGTYTGTAFLFGYHELTFEFNLTNDVDEVHIPLKELIFPPTGLTVDTENQMAGRALLNWDAKPKGEPWNEGFEDNFPPKEWEQIITNEDGFDLEEDGVDWLFTWQEHGTIHFSDGVVRPYEGKTQAFIFYDQGVLQDEWLISHEFEAPGDDVVFWYMGRNGTDNQHLYLKISTDNGETWDILWDSGELPNAFNEYDYPAIVNLSYYAGQNVRLAWNAYSEVGLLSAFTLDNITVGDMRIDTKDLTPVSKSKRTARKNISDSTLTAKNPRFSSTRDSTPVPRVKEEDMYPNGHTSGTKTLIGYDIYLDDMVTPIATNVSETQYLYKLLDEGDYLAGVMARYTTGDSELAVKGFTITEGTTGIDGNEGDINNLKVYPNPVSDWLTIECPEDITHIALYNSLGQAVISNPIQNERFIKLSVENLPAGVYLLQIRTNSEQYIQKVQVRK